VQITPGIAFPVEIHIEFQLMLLRIDVGIILSAPEEIHIEFQLLLVRYYSYQVCPVITITLCRISNFYRKSLHTRTTVSKNLDRSAKNVGSRTRDPEAMMILDTSTKKNIVAKDLVGLLLGEIVRLILTALPFFPPFLGFIAKN
jgi:hypothetical protein